MPRCSPPRRWSDLYIFCYASAYRAADLRDPCQGPPCLPNLVVTSHGHRHSVQPIFLPSLSTPLSPFAYLSFSLSLFFSLSLYVSFSNVLLLTLSLGVGVGISPHPVPCIFVRIFLLAGRNDFTDVIGARDAALQPPLIACCKICPLRCNASLAARSPACLKRVKLKLQLAFLFFLF